MNHRSFPIAIILAALLVSIPGQSIATPMGADAAASSGSGSGLKSSDKDDDKLQEILKEIFTLGGLFDFGGSGGGSKGGSRDSRKSSSDAEEVFGSEQFVEEIFRLPIIYPEDPMPRDPDLAAPVPEPTGALLFGMGILAVAGRRARSERLR